MNMRQNKTETPSRGAAQHAAMAHKGRALPSPNKAKSTPVNNFGRNKGNTMKRGAC